jgi:isoleucyl-tRNA synthetase
MDTKNEAEKSEVARREEEILEFWNEHDIFNKSVETPAGNRPTGDILAGTIKDAIPRFWTMNGKRVVRKWGWDCHGLPLENIIEKRLGLATKRDIEAMGVKQFNEAAREAVLEYADDWREIIPRMGRFVDMNDDYKTMDATYTESVWWVFSELNRKGLVYEGFKSMHLCPRCGTTLSNFEVNQGYKDIKDIAVTVKLPLLDDAGNVTDTSLLVWTTTPWTLPGNMAAAVHNDIEYVKVRCTLEDKNDVVILAKARLAQLGTEHYEILEEMKGSALVGKRYEPPFDVFKNQDIKNKENAWKIYHADYVELGEEGTGAVHLAPAYGEEDMELAKREDVPVVHHVDADGRFKEFVTHFAGQLVKPKDDEKSEVSHLDADIEIVKRLKDAGQLFKKENITHSYPHCWRCDTPLLNYATTSWFVRVTDIKDKLVEENNKVKWVPEHVGTNRFGRWLEGARDWAVSRQRYWGAPLPIWRREDNHEYKVFGSLDDLKQYVPKSGNTYLLMRHGESESNHSDVTCTNIEDENPLTELGKTQAVASAELLKDKNIDLIITSPFERTRQTAEIVRDALQLEQSQVIVDARLEEVQLGTMNGIANSEYHTFLKENGGWCIAKPEGGESWSDVKQRVGAFLYDINTRYSGKRILIVAHNSPLRMLGAVNDGAVLGSTAFDHDEDGKRYGNAEVRELVFTPLPHNDNYELDFHRPYIDDIELVDTDGTKLVRVPDVFDCWFESGAMPYAQNHYPFENLETFNPEKGIGFPANFIAEGLDQTRGWFYSLIVLGTALFGKSPFQNVVVNGLALAEDGKKMSKSLQNYPDPMDLVHRLGADAMRFYLLTSPIVRSEDLSFSEKEVLELQRKNLGRLHNVLAMYETYKDENVRASADSAHVLDRWMIARVNEGVHDITEGYSNYELDKATRPIEGLIDDLSVWYLRRSRERLKGDDIEDKNATLATLRYVLKQLSLVMAPAMPFYAEYLFQRVREESDKVNAEGREGPLGDAESVHLMPWPKGGEVDKNLLEQMQRTRQIVTFGLEKRAKANIKVRQPLPSLGVNLPEGDSVPDEHRSLIEDELNVKHVQFNYLLKAEAAQYSVNGSDVTLDTVITPELKLEGEVRELMRAIQDARKEMGLTPQDRIVLILDDATQLLVRTDEAMMRKTVGAEEIRIGQGADRVLSLDGKDYHFGIEKIG